MRVIVLILTICKFSTSFQLSEVDDDSWPINNPDELKSRQFWTDDAERTLRNKLLQRENRNKAKNVIFFLGDGMSIPTVTASRIYDGQTKSFVGERNSLFFEKFPYVGLSKTYCVDKQVADSACTATAYLSGIKANYKTIGVTAAVEVSDCESASLPENQVETISKWAQDHGKATGFVTTTRVTHASPAGTYAHTSHRDYESDTDIYKMGNNPDRCIDIARQLVENEVSKNFNIIMGGGGCKLLSNGTVDSDGYVGERSDGRNIIHEWMHGKRGSTKYVYNGQQLKELNTTTTDNLIGIFATDHFNYNLDNDGSQPTLQEMTDAAIRILQKEDNGFFLFVEGGRIDFAHHETRAKKALDETVQFAAAVKGAYELTNPNETLIVVSADHSHTMTINGYPDIGNSITGVGTDESDLDYMKYMTLSYANGPAFKNFFYSPRPQMSSGFQRLLFGGGREDIKRYDVNSMLSVENKDFQYPAAVPLVDETHGGDDVAIYANGPWSHLFTGVMEQNILPVLMGFAGCFGPGLTSCSAIV